MAGVVNINGKLVVNICPDGTEGEVITIYGLDIQLPKQPPHKEIINHDKPQKEQYWRKQDFPEVLLNIKSSDEWEEQSKEFKAKYIKWIDREWERRRNGIWFYNNGVPTYITGNHYMQLQWGVYDGYPPYYYEFQRDIELHWEACVADPRSMGQVYVKCRRSGYTNGSSNVAIEAASRVKNNHVGIVSKTGEDAQKVVYAKAVNIFRHYPFFFKPMQDGTTNPMSSINFREPAKKITKTNKTALKGEGLNTILDWHTTTTNAYDGKKTYRLVVDESGKWEKTDINEFWQIHRTCLIKGRKIIGKCRMGSTVNQLDKGGEEFVKLIKDSDVTKRDKNGRTHTGLYLLFIPAYKALEGFFDLYGRCVENDPKEPVVGIDGEILVDEVTGLPLTIGAKTYLKNEREALKNNPSKLNETIRQFPFTLEEACRDSAKESLFNIMNIYSQLDYNSTLYPNPVVRGNFVWRNNERDTVVDFIPSETGTFRVSWRPEPEFANQKEYVNGHWKPLKDYIGIGGVDSYDINRPIDENQASKGALIMYNKFHMDDNAPSNMVVLEYADRPPLATTFYEDVLKAAVYYGYPLLIENNKRRIIDYFEERGYYHYVMDRPDYLMAKSARYQKKEKGVPSNSEDVLDKHAQAIEWFVEEHVGRNNNPNSANYGEMGKMYFDRTLNDLIGFDITKRTKYDLSIALGYALLGAQKVHKVAKKMEVKEVQWFREYKYNA